MAWTLPRAAGFVAGVCADSGEVDLLHSVMEALFAELFGGGGDRDSTAATRGGVSDLEAAAPFTIFELGDAPLAFIAHHHIFQSHIQSHYPVHIPYTYTI